MKRPKWYSILLIGLALLLAISVVACGKPALAQYYNEYWEYGIKVPEDWIILKETISADPPYSYTALGPPPPQTDLIEITVRPRNEVGLDDIETMAQNLVERLRSDYDSLVILDNSKTQGKWDWHIVFENKEAHEEIFFIDRQGYFCMLIVAYSKEESGIYLWNKIIESFFFGALLLSHREMHNIEKGLPQYFGFEES